MPWLTRVLDKAINDDIEVTLCGHVVESKKFYLGYEGYSMKYDNRSCDRKLSDDITKFL